MQHFDHSIFAYAKDLILYSTKGFDEIFKMDELKMLFESNSRTRRAYIWSLMNLALWWNTWIDQRILIFLLLIMTRYQRIVILSGTYHKVKKFDLSTKVISIDDLRVWIFRGELLKHLFRYQDGQCLVNRLETMPRPLLTGLVLRLLCRKECFF